MSSVKYNSWKHIEVGHATLVMIYLWLIGQATSIFLIHIYNVVHCMVRLPNAPILIKIIRFNALSNKSKSVSRDDSACNKIFILSVLINTLRSFTSVIGITAPRFKILDANWLRGFCCLKLIWHCLQWFLSRCNHVLHNLRYISYSMGMQS